MTEGRAPRGAKEAIHRRGPGLWLRIKTRLRIIYLAMRAEEVVEEVEAPPSRLGWDTVAGLFGEAMEGHSTRRLTIGPGSPLGREELAAALEAMGYPLTGRRVVLTVVHGYEGQLTPDSVPRGALTNIETKAKEARVNDKKIEEAKS